VNVLVDVNLSPAWTGVLAAHHIEAVYLPIPVEGEASWRSAIEARLRGLDATARILTSQLSRLECRTKPIRDGAAALLARYDAAANRIDVWICLRASSIEPPTFGQSIPSRPRTRFTFATAIDGGSMAFWTGDAALARCLEIPVVVLSGPP